MPHFIYCTFLNHVPERKSLQKTLHQLSSPLAPLTTVPRTITPEFRDARCNTHITKNSRHIFHSIPSHPIPYHSIPFSPSFLFCFSSSTSLACGGLSVVSKRPTPSSYPVSLSCSTEPPKKKITSPHHVDSHAENEEKLQLQTLHTRHQSQSSSTPSSELSTP